MLKVSDTVTNLEDPEKFIIELETNRLQLSSDLIAQAAAIEQRLRKHPVSDEDAIKAGASFITFTPLGGG